YIRSLKMSPSGDDARRAHKRGLRTLLQQGGDFVQRLVEFGGVAARAGARSGRPPPVPPTIGATFRHLRHRHPCILSAWCSKCAVGLPGLLTEIESKRNALNI